MKNSKLKLSEEALILAIRQKSDLGARALHDMYAKSLFVAIQRIIPDSYQAEDILQESFIKIWFSFEKYSEDKGRLFTWMVRIARNLSFDSLTSRSSRNKNCNKELIADEIILNSAENNGLRFDRYNVRNALRFLRERERVILELIYLKGYKHVEVAEELEMPLGSVKTSLRSGIAELKRIYNNDILAHAS